ncbi:MAG: discoidin domain-containing protein [Blastocatellia bacterium]|nr:discoidin domain-containing protein [Blastocatellia bacterium]
MALSLLAIVGITSLPNAQSNSANTQAQTAPLRIAIKVNNGSLPVTVGVPIPEGAGLTDVASLGVTDMSGNAVPASLRVMARWGGTADNGAKPVKWVLVDFKPSSMGGHLLTRAGRPSVAGVSVTEGAAGWRIANSQIEMEIPKQGEAVIRGFKLGGAEMLKAPASLQMTLPRRALVNKAGASPDQVIVNDTTQLKVGDEVRFEHTDTLKWDASAGSSRLVTSDPTFAANRTYRLEEGTPRQEDVLVASALPADLKTAAPLKFSHAAGSAIRDLSLEGETARIKALNGQGVQFTAALRQPHGVGEKLVVPNAANETVTASVERTVVEEANPLRVVVRQDGLFRGERGRTPATLNFTLRYYAYADQPYVRVRLRLINNGVYGFGAGYSNLPPYAQHAILRSLTAIFPTVEPGLKSSEVLSGAEARARISRKESGASLTAGKLEIAAPEFIETWPKALRGTSGGLRYDLLPDLGSDYIFDGARARTMDFYLGRSTTTARALTSGLNATLEPAYIASTGAVRPVFVEKRDWSKVFPGNTESAEAANRMERMFASSYAVEVNESAGATQAMSAFEYREAGQNGEQFGWRNFGDLAWGDGYANVHYDLPFILLREYLRTGDARAFKLGGEMARFRADWGQHHANDYPNAEQTINYRGMAFYEKGDHGSFREPVPSHMWIEGLWLYWALTGDESVREAATEGSAAFLRINFTNESVLQMNETRWLGWPTLGLMAAYRYTGEPRYLIRARENVDALVGAEESYGRKGYYLARGWDDQLRIQPWGWSYSMLGVIEYWRETGDKRTADFLVRSADWLIGKGSSNPPLTPGKTTADGSYLPNGSPYFWFPDKVSEPGSIYNAGLTLPVLVTAARISNRADLMERARLIFRDYAFYRDLGEGVAVPPARRHVINFRSLLYPGSVTKAYGQMGLTVFDYLAEAAGGFVPPRGRGSVYEPAPQSQPMPATTPKATATPQPALSLDTPQDTLINVALNRPASASSYQVWPNCLCTPTAANDGQLNANGKSSIWHSAVNSGTPEWWQVDLGQKYRLAQVDLLFRNDADQEATRRNFEVIGSNDPTFRSSTRLGYQGAEASPFGQVWRAAINDLSAYRYVRVRKLRAEAGLYGEAYFNLAEVRVFAPAADSTRLLLDPSTTTMFDSKVVPASFTPGSPEEMIPPPLELSLMNLVPLKVEVGQTLELVILPFDQSGREMRISAANLPHGATFDAANRRLRFPPNTKQAGGIYQINFRGDNTETQFSAKLDIVVVSPGAPEVRLLRPTTKTRILTNTETTISWSTPVNTDITKYEVYLSTDGGATYPFLLAELPGYTIEWEWKVPKNFPVINRSMLRVMIRAFDAENRVGLDFTSRDLRVLKNTR